MIFIVLSITKKKVSCILRCILLQVIARHRIGNYFYVINQPYSSTLGCAVAISRKRHCVLCRIVEKIFYFFYFLCHEIARKTVLYVESANGSKLTLCSHAWL